MKLMATLNVQDFVTEYNKYAKAFNFVSMTTETVFSELDKIYGGFTYVKGQPDHVVMSAAELETLADLLDIEGWKELALDKALRMWFLK